MDKVPGTRNLHTSINTRQFKYLKELQVIINLNGDRYKWNLGRLTSTRPVHLAVSCFSCLPFPYFIIEVGISMWQRGRQAPF